MRFSHSSRENVANSPPEDLPLNVSERGKNVLKCRIITLDTCYEISSKRLVTIHRLSTIPDSFSIRILPKKNVYVKKSHKDICRQPKSGSEKYRLLTVTTRKLN